MHHTFKATAIVAVGLLALAGCGGGGGGGSSSSSGSNNGGGTGTGVPAPSLAVSPKQLEVTADSRSTSNATATLTVSVINAPTDRIYVGAGSTANGIERLSFASSGNQLILTVVFKAPSVLGPGTYADSVTLGICSDSECTQLKTGTEVVVPVTYTVALSATVTLTANPTTTGVGVPVTLSWSSTDAASCTASGAWSGDLPSSGSQAVIPGSVGDHTYTLSCAGPGLPAQASVTVTAVLPSVSLSVFPSRVTLGKPVTLRWWGENAAGCVASGAWSGALPAAGHRTLSPSAQGDAVFHIACSNSAASADDEVSVTVGPAPVSPPATAYRMSERHDGVLKTSNGVKHPATSAPTWTVDLGAPVSYPLIADGKVFVTTANPDGSYGSRLYGLNRQTGAIVWGPVAIPGVYFGSGLTHENGRVFVLMFDGGVSAFNAANGAALWTARLPGYWYSGSPNAYGGRVFVTGNGGLSALDSTDGTILWTAVAGASTGWVSPAISSEGIYTDGSNSCGASAFVPTTGRPLWESVNWCGDWVYTPVVKQGIVFGRTRNALNLFTADAGESLVQLASDHAPSVTDDAVVALNAGTLSSTRLSDRVQAWTFSGDGGLVTAPVVVNDTVFVGSSTGNVYGLDLATGAQAWLGVSPKTIGPDSESGGPQPPSGPAAGEDMLIFTAGDALVAWRLE